MQKANQAGFSIIEALLVLMAVGILGATGWYVYHAQKSAKRDYSAAAKLAMSASSNNQTDAFITSGPGKNQKTYTNKTLGFSFDFPTTVYGDGTCQKSTTVVDDKGNAVASPSHYVQGYITLPTNVVSTGNAYYIIPKTTAVLTNFKNIKVNGEDYPVAKSCSIEALTGQNISYYLENSDGVHLYTEIPDLQLTAVAAKQGDALSAAAGRALDGTIVKVTGLTPDKSGNWDYLTYTCSGNVCVDLDDSSLLRYYPAKNLLIYWGGVGDSCELGSTLNSKGCYDQQIISSFKLID